MFSDSLVVELWKKKFGSPISEVSVSLTRLQDTEDAFPRHLHERAFVNLARETEML